MSAKKRTKQRRRRTISVADDAHRSMLRFPLADRHGSVDDGLDVLEAGLTQDMGECAHIVQ